MDLFANEKFSDGYLIIIKGNMQSEPFPIHSQVLATKSKFFARIFDMPGSIQSHNGKPLYTIDISSIPNSTIDDAFNILQLFYKNVKEMENFHCSSYFSN